MLFKGIIIKIEETHLIVLNGEGVFEKIHKKENAQIGQKIIYTAEDCVKTTRKDNVYSFQLRKVVFVAAMFVFVVLLSNFFGMKTDINLPNEISIATIMTIDINPSVKLALDEEDKVLEVTAINKDASTLDLSGIVGLTAADAVEKVVSLALNAGYINSEDLIDDYVLITTISLLADSNQKIADSNQKLAVSQFVDKQPITSNPHLDELKVKIEEKVANSEVLKEVNVAIIKASKVEMKIAEEKHVPVGLYVVNGDIDFNGENSTVKEYFSHQDQVDDFKNKGVVIQQDKEAIIKLINNYIEKLRAHSYDVSTLENALNDEKVNPEQILEQIRVIWKQFETQNHDNQNGPKSTNLDNNENEKDQIGNFNNNHSNKDNNSNNSNSHETENDNKTNKNNTTEVENSTIETTAESTIENGSHGNGINNSNNNNNNNSNDNDNHNANYHDSKNHNGGRKK